MRSSLSERVQIPRNPLSRRNNRSSSFCRLYSSMSYSHGRTRLRCGGTTGLNRNAPTLSRVHSSSYTLSIKRLTVYSCFPMLSSNNRPSIASGTFPPDSLKETIPLSPMISPCIFVFHSPRLFPVACGPFFSGSMSVRMHFDRR
jgi:hypothetical protein